MTRYLLIGTPDNSDPFVEEFTSMPAAAKRAAILIRDYDPEWPEKDIVAEISEGHTISYHDYSSLRIEVR